MSAKPARPAAVGSGGITRFTSAHPCPICGGGEDDSRGDGRRCYGFLSSDLTHAHCTREEHAGRLSVNPGSDTYAHRLVGPCECGETHDAAPVPAAARKTGRRPYRERFVESYIYRDAWGEPVRRVVRLKDPKEFPQSRPDGSGGWKSGVEGVPHLPYRLPEMLAGRGATIWYVEGEKDANRLAGRGLVATCNDGRAGKAKIVSAIAHYFQGRSVCVIPDNDAKGRRHALSVATILLAAGAASVKVVELPGQPEKGDASDFLDAGGGPDGLLALAEAAPLFAPRPPPEANGHAPTGAPPRVHVGGDSEGEDGPTNEAPDDPARLARLMLDASFRNPDGPTLHFWQGDYVEWDGCWRPVFSGDLLARAHWAAKVEFDRLNRKAIAAAEADRRRRGLAPPAPEELPRTRKVTAALVANVALALSGYTRLDPRTPQPSWLEGPGPFPAEDVLPARNALVYLPGLVRGDQCSILRPTPRFFAPYCLDYDFDPAAPEPVKWFCFLGSLWPDDPESIAALQEWFGLLLTPDTTYQKILLLIGPRRSGKGTIARVIRALIGPSNVANPTLASLATNFGVTPLIGSPAAVVTDARLSGRADIAQVVERLLSISGEDAQTIDRKHLPAITVKLPTRFALLSNELPPLTDASGSLAGRLIILRLTRSFYDAEDRILTEDLLTELPSILLWSIEGWRRLRERGRLVQPEAGKAMIEEMEDLGSPVKAFLKDQCKVGPEAKVMAAELYGAWKAWCQEHGRDNAGDAQGFGRNLRAAIPGLNTTQPRQDDGSRPRFYMGVRLLDPDEDPD